MGEEDMVGEVVVLVLIGGGRAVRRKVARTDGGLLSRWPLYGGEGGEYLCLHGREMFQREKTPGLSKLCKIATILRAAAPDVYSD